MMTMNDEVVAIAGCLVEKNQKFLLIQEATPEIYGLWNVPAGHIDSGETVEEAAVRETREESGFIVSIDAELGTYSMSNNHLIHVFQARIHGGEIAFPKNEILDARWFSYDEIKEFHEHNQLRGEYVLFAIEKYLTKVG